MFIRQLAYLRALARERHFARAAATCNVSQPTLSAAIRGLEEELAVPIVRRGPRFMGLTPEGERVLAWAQQILADFEGLQQDLSLAKEGPQGRLRVGVVPAALPALPHLLESFLARHPHVGVDLLSMTSLRIQEALERFEIELGVTYLDNEPLRNVRSVPVYRESHIFAPADPRFTGRTEITWSEVASASLCLLTPTMQNRRIIDTALAEVGHKAAPRIEADTHLVLAGFVRTGTWATVLPHTYEWVLRGQEGMTLLPVGDPTRTHEVGLVLLDRDPVPPLASALIESLSPPPAGRSTLRRG